MTDDTYDRVIVEGFLSNRERQWLQDDVLEVGAVLKSIVADVGHVTGNGKTCQSCTIVECALADSGNRLALGDISELYTMTESR